MESNLSPSELARQLGRLGGLKSKANGADYSAMGKKAAAKRWAKQNKKKKR